MSMSVGKTVRSKRATNSNPWCLLLILSPLTEERIRPGPLSERVFPSRGSSPSVAPASLHPCIHDGCHAILGVPSWDLSGIFLEKCGMPSDGMDTSLCLVNMFFGKEPITFFFCHSVLKVPLHLVPSDYFRAAKYCIADVVSFHAASWQRPMGYRAL